MNLILALTLANAHALSCLWGIADASIVDGDVVPTNAEFVVTHTFDADAELGLAVLDANGDFVDAEIEMTDTYAVVRPGGMQPGAYTLTSLDEEHEWWALGFTVEDIEDVDAPDAPEILDAYRDSSVSEWGKEKGIIVELADAGEPGHYEYQLATKSDFSDAFSIVSRWNNAYLGQGLCDSDEGYDHSERYYLRVRFVDVAGNPSEWAETNKTVGNKLGCNVANAPMSLGLVLLAALGMRRRQQR